MIKEAYCSYEISKLLKERGFDEECTHYYSYEDDELIEYTNGVYSRNSKDCHRCTSPTHQMACAWLRNKGIIIDILAQSNKTTSPEYMFNIWDYSATQWNKHICEYQPAFVEQEFDFTTYEEAVEAALKYSLENLL